MIDSAIRHLAPSRNGQTFAAGEYQSKVHIFRFNTQRCLKTIDTILDFGGRRLALSEDGRIRVAASYYSPGIRGYEVGSGRVIWERRDLRKVQSLRTLPLGAMMVEIDRKPLHLLQTESGETLEKIRGARDLLMSPFSEVRFLNKHVPELQDKSGERIAKVPRETFAILADAFTPKLLVISESGGAVRAFCARSGEPRWTFRPRLKTHVLKLAYNETAGKIVAGLWHYGGTGEHILLVINAETGALENEFKLGKLATYVFCQKGANLLTSDGKLLDTATGKLVRRYKFPKINHSDE